MDTNTYLPNPARQHLDSIVQQMTTNGESEPNIQSVVNDFKQKYSHQTIDSLKSQQAQAEKNAKQQHSIIGGYKNFYQGLGPAAMQVGVGDVAQFAASAIEAPKTIATGKASGKTYNLPGLKPFQSIESEAQGAVQSGTEGPLKAILTKGAKTIAEGVQTSGTLSSALGDVNLVTGEAKSGFVQKAFSKLGDNQAEKNAIKLLEPKLSASERASELKSGNISTKGVKGTVVQNLDPKMVETAMPYVKGAKNEVEAANNLRTGIKTEAENLINGVGDRGGTWSNNNLVGVAKDVKVPIGVRGVSDTQVAGIQDYVKVLGEGAPKNAGGALTVAKTFRETITSEYGENIWTKDTPIANYIKSVNKALNDFAASRLPDGTLADGTTFADSLKKQTLLYQALDNVASKTPSIGTPTTVLGKASQLVKNNLGKIATGAGVTGAVGAYEAYKAITK